MLSADDILHQHYPALQRWPLLNMTLRQLLRYLLQERHFQHFAREYPYLRGMDFVEQVLEYLGVGYLVSDQERENIPVSGRVMIIANHPIGSLDGLALLKLVHGSRPDVRIVANELLDAIEPLRPCLLSVNVLQGRSAREQICRIDQALANEEAVIMFPAGEVSRLGAGGIRDCRWQKGFLRLAARARAPILPVHVAGRNSLRFYAASLLYKPLSTLLLASEMFRRRQQTLSVTVGGLIPCAAYAGLNFREKDQIALFRRHLYRIGSGRQGIFPTETAIARPERRISLKKSVQAGELLGRTPDGKEIYLHQGASQEAVLREIARLRELTFRAVGEGSGKRRDTDQFDQYYQHLLLWSAEDLEIVGAYRFADAQAVCASHGCPGLYTHSLFQFDQESFPCLAEGLELGRSFVQQRYWGKRSLDYLWFGIGAYLRRNPQYRYLFGPVSISNAMPLAAKELLIYFYQLYFSAPVDMAEKSAAFPAISRHPFHFSQPATELARSFRGDEYQQDLVQLKSLLAAMGTAIPTLYKQYSELCPPGGVRFLGFNVDTAFNDCVDGLVVVDLQQLKPAKRKRYIDDCLPST